MIDLLEAAFVLFAGLCFGSFATMASYRLPRSEGIVFTPSHCTLCNARLRVADLFPVMSWLAQKGKCRHCGTGIHYRYPLIECATAAVFLSLYFRYGFNLPSVLLMMLAVCMVIFFVTDFEHRIIPDEIQIAMLLIGVVFRILIEIPLEEIISGAVVGLLIGLGLRYGYSFLRNREGLGWGDVKFLFVVGVWIGVTPLLPFLFFSGVLGVATAMVWRMMGKGAEFPFGPALGMSMFLCIIYPQLPNAFWNMHQLFM